MCKITVFCRATADSITLFWDKPEHSAGRAQYELFVDGRPTGGSDRTHFTVTGLMPDTEYSVEADESVVVDGKIDMTLVNAIAFDPYTHGYYKVTERVGEAFKDGLQLKK